MELSDSWASRAPTVAPIGAATAVFADLRSAIEGGQLAVGERLPSELALATRFGVSRSVIREALRSTTAIGLTSTQNGRGTFVVSNRSTIDRHVGAYSITALGEARPHIEGPAARLAAQRRTDADLAGLNQLLELMRAAESSADWIDLDGQFHRLIARCSGNAVFSSAVDDISASIVAQSRLVNVAPDRRRNAEEEHQGIVDAIAARSADDAQAAMNTHLDRVARAIDQLL